MARINVFLSFALLVACHLVATVSSLRIETLPSTYTEEDVGPINISCHLDGADFDATELHVLEIVKDGGLPLVFARTSSGITFGAGYSDPRKFQADGLISQNVGDSYLRLSILAPSKTDQGDYSCKLFYSDKAGLLNEHRATRNLTVDTLDLHKVVRELVDEVEFLNKDRIAKGSELAVLSEKYQNQSQEISRLRDQVSYTVAFSASLSSTKHLDLVKGDVIVFPDVIMTEGQGYDEKTGIFRAPRAGLYVFHLALLTKTTSCQLQVQLMSNTKILSSLYAFEAAGGIYEQTSVSSVTALKKGDKVKAVVYGTACVYLGKWSEFSGYLLKVV